MRLASMSICSLIWISIFSSCFYLYLILRQFASSPTYKLHKNYLENIFHQSWRSGERARYEHEINYVRNETFRVYQERIGRVRNHIVSQLYQWELNGASPLNKLHRLNPYEVKYEKGPKGRIRPTRSQLCSIPIKLYPPSAFLANTSKPANGHDGQDNNNSSLNINFEDFILLDNLLEQFRYPKSCALVSNAASILNSGNGQGIDTHEIVMRFNNAPAGGQYSVDVGSRTHVRILNSQMIENENLLNSSSLVAQSLYDNVVNIVWDAGHYRDSHAQWTTRRHNFFAKYVSLLRERSDLKMYLLDSRVVWDCWDSIQDTRHNTLIRNPVSSGFLGVTLLVQLCEQVTLFEIVPSTRSSAKCHYYDNTTGSGCTMGDWHPLASEKLFFLDLNESDNWATFERGQARISGCRS